MNESPHEIETAKSTGERLVALEIRTFLLEKRMSNVEGKLTWLLGITITTLGAIIATLLRGGH